MDIFESKNIGPMLIGENEQAFDSPDYIYELKLDGERCIAYLDDNTELRNKRNIKMLPKVPELKDIHKQVRTKCILDGELIVIKDGKPDFYEIQRRSLMSNTFKIELLSNKYPATFTAFDILYHTDHEVTSLPLMERKKLLEDTVMENSRLAVSRYIEEKGTEFYKLAEQNDLEGIVAKRKDSKYNFDTRTKDWIKIKNLLDEDFVICGYEIKENGVASLILGQYKENELIYKSHVIIGKNTPEFKIISSVPQVSAEKEVIIIQPTLVCTVKFMMKNKNGSLRQPVFKSLRGDKEPKECIDK